MTSEVTEISSPSKSYRSVVIGAFLAFICLIGLAYRAIEVAQNGAEASKREAEAAKQQAADAAAKVDELQRSQDCTIRVMVRVVNGLLKNSIQQNDVLLVSAEAGDRLAVIEGLKGTRAELVSIAVEAAKANEECT